MGHRDRCFCLCFHSIIYPFTPFQCYMKEFLTQIPRRAKTKIALKWINVLAYWTVKKLEIQQSLAHLKCNKYHYVIASLNS